MTEVNPDAVAAAVAAELVKDFLAKTGALLNDASRTVFQRLFPNLERHLAATYQRNREVKIISNRDVPVEFSSIYVPCFYRLDNRTLADVEVVDQVRLNNRIVLRAIGGAGKTFLMRFTWTKLFREQSGRVPIFVELRKLNAVSTVDLENFVRATAFGTDSFTPQNFSHFCDDGVFIFILDGFDEVVKEKRPDLESQIIELAKRYPSAGIIVSGRPDDRFDGWQGFKIIKALPLDFGQFRQLITQVPFEIQTKSSFLKIADEASFSSHSSFLSNPLLSVMMLLTYRDNAETSPAPLSES